MRVVSYIVGLILTVGLIGSTAVAAPDFKVGFVDLQRALAESKAGKAAKKVYETEVNEAQKDLDKKKEAFQKRRADFEKQRETLNEAALGSKREELIGLEKDLKRSFQDSEAMLRRRNTQIVGELLGKIRKVVNTVGQEKGFTVILEKSSDAVLYADSNIDLTEEVVKAFNAKAN